MITDKTYIADMIWFAIFACMTEGRNHFVSIFSYSIIAELLSKATNYDVLSLRIFMYVHMYIWHSLHHRSMPASIADLKDVYPFHSTRDT